MNRPRRNITDVFETPRPKEYQKSIVPTDIPGDNTLAPTTTATGRTTTERRRKSRTLIPRNQLTMHRYIQIVNFTDENRERTSVVPDMKPLTLKANITELNAKQMEAARLSRAASIYNKQGLRAAQEYLGGDFEIVPEYSGRTHITVVNSDNDYEIAVRGIDPLSPYDVNDVATMTINPESAQSTRDLVSTIESLPSKPVRLSGFSRGGGTATTAGNKYDIDVVAINPSLNHNHMRYRPGESSVDIIRTTGDFASTGVIASPDHWKVHVIDGGGSDGISDHQLDRILSQPSSGADVYGRPMRPEVDLQATALSGLGAAGFGLGVAEVVYNVNDKPAPKPLQVSNEVVNTGIMANEAPSMMVGDGMASDTQYFFERLGITDYLTSSQRKEQDRQIAQEEDAYQADLKFMDFMNNR